MKAGYKILRGLYLPEEYNYLNVFNWETLNEIGMFQDKIKEYNAIGCWKLKTLKNEFIR